MNISVISSPPSMSDIESERVRVSNAISRASLRLKTVEMILLCFFIFTAANLITAIELFLYEIIVHRGFYYGIYGFIYYLSAPTLFIVFVICGFFLNRYSERKEVVLAKLKMQLTYLAEADQEDCERLIPCLAVPELKAYRDAVIAQSRKFIKDEVCAMVSYKIQLKYKREAHVRQTELKMACDRLYLEPC